MTDFDKVIDRHGTNSIKWDRIADIYKQENLIPLWIADMDFPAPASVQKAFSDYVASGIYGYTDFPESLYQAIIDWENQHHGYSLTADEILFSPGVVPSIGLAIQAYSQPGDAILINDPVYPPFAAMVKNNDRRLVRNRLLVEDGMFRFDFAEFERQLIEENIKIFILCNPHNPGGRVWEEEELRELGELCQRHGVLVISDEIHQDLVFAPYKHHSFQTIAKDFEKFSIILTAATKTFNMAGIKNSMIFIKDPDLRKKMQALQKGTEQDTINTFGMLGTEAAFTGGEEWLTELLSYLKENVAYACDFFTELPQIRLLKPQGTYLLWLDFSAYGMSDKELEKKMIEEAGVVLNAGRTFGPAGKQHMRLNVACPRETLKLGLARIKAAFSE